MFLVFHIPRSEAVGLVQQKAAVKKHNLQKWKYAELRDAINTSCGEDSDVFGVCVLPSGQ